MYNVAETDNVMQFFLLKMRNKEGIQIEKQFCEVCLDTTNFERIYLIEEVTVKGETFEVDHEYDKCENCNELFEPIEDVDKNIKNDYRIYREKAG